MKRKKIGLMAAMMVLGAAAASAQTMITHTNLQSVTSTGTSAWVETFPFTIQGVILNDPEEMLDPAYNPDAAGVPDGGQFQMFIQAVAAGDRGGTAIFMSQMSFIGGNNYDEAGWVSEMQRVRYDGNGRKFRKGDLVEVTARKGLFYNGKFNINEAHLTLEENNFDVTLVRPNTVLPQAEVLTLADLKHADDSAIFDATRATGGEHYQGMRVRIDGIRLMDTNGWGQAAWSNRICTAADDSGRTFTLRMPRTDLGPAPATSTWFSATGILNQENSRTNGYELFVQEIGPVLDVGRSASGGIAASFSADYEGYVLEASDDGLETWSPVDATPVKVIWIEDDGASPNRAYRLRKAD
jgi:hypothetical protein